MELCQRIQDEKGMPADWSTSVAIPISRGKRDIMNCGEYRGVKVLEHAMKIEMKKKGYSRKGVTTDVMQFGFVLGKDTIDAVFTLRKIQEG